MKNLTIKDLDTKHAEFVFKKYMEEYGLEAANDLASRIESNIVAQADLWGINYGSEVQNAN